MTVFYRGSTLHMLVDSSVSFFLFTFRCFFFSACNLFCSVCVCVCVFLFISTHSLFLFPHSMVAFSLSLSLFISVCFLSSHISFPLSRSLPSYLSISISFPLPLYFGLVHSFIHTFSLSPLSLSLTLSFSPFPLY